MTCPTHGDTLIHEPGGDDMPTIHGRRYCPTCQAEVMAALTCATCDLMDDGLPCEYHRGFADGVAMGESELAICERASQRNANAHMGAERDLRRANERLARVEALAKAAKRDEATSLSRTFDGGTFGAWVSADQILAALTGADQ